MLIKITGAVLIISAGTIYGFSRAEKLAKRERTLISIKTALGLLESEIVFTSHHLKQAFLHINSICNCDNFFLYIAENIENLGIAKAWCMSVDHKKNDLCITDSDADILKILASELGRSDREHQIKNINHVSSLLSQAAQDAHNEYKKSAKFYRSMGILGGIFIVLLLF